MSNPLQSNGGLQGLMKDLDSVSSPDNFMEWRNSFVDELESFLGDPGAGDKARAADKSIQVKAMPKIDQALAKLEGCLDGETGKLTEGVKSQMAINKLKESCQETEKRLAHLIPTSSDEITQCGYNKWNLAAVLIRDGFLIYNDMMYHQAQLQVLVTILEEAQVDRQIIDAMQYYCKRIAACIAVLQDLGLMKVLDKTREFVKDTKERAPSNLSEISAKLEAAKPEGTRSTRSSTGVNGTPAKAAPQKLDKDTLGSQETKSQTINVRAINDPKNIARLAALRNERKKPGRSKSMSNANDPERTAKPTGKMKLPGSGPPKGRGVGKTISKEEAREVKQKNPNAHIPDKNMKKKPPKRSNTMPNLPASRKPAKPPSKKGDPEEDPQEDDDGEKDEKEEEPGKPKPNPKKTSPKAAGGSKPKSTNTSSSNGKSAPGKESVQQQQTKSTSTSPAPPSTKAAAAQPKKPVVETKVHITIDYHGRRAKFKVDLALDTIGSIKKRMEQLTKLAVEQQLLMAKSSREEYADDNQSLAECSIEKGSELLLECRPFNLQAKIMCQGGKKIPLTDIRNTTTLKQIKEQINELTGLAVLDQEIYYKKEEMIVGANTVQEMGIVDGSTLVVQMDEMIDISVTSMMDNKLIRLKFNASTDVLKDIKKALEKETGISVSNQKLFMPADTEIIEKPGKTFLRDYKIEDESELFMEPKVIKITVELPDGTTTDLRVSLTSDMSQIIEAFVRTGTKAKVAKLKFQGKEFPKGETVKAMGLIEGSLVKLELEEEESGK